jgi:hypothetical protein
MSLTRDLAIGGFVFVMLALAAVEIAARRDDSKIPTIADMCGFVMRYRVGRLPVGRIAVFGFWWWVGFHFFAR